MRSAAQKVRSDAANEHPVLPPQGHLLHELLGLVVLDRHQAVVEINEQVFELVPQVGQRLPEGLLRHSPSVGSEPLANLKRNRWTPRS